LTNAWSGEENIVLVTGSISTTDTASSRLQEVIEDAKIFVEAYESKMGKEPAKKIERKWADSTEDIGRILDGYIVEKFCSIKNKKEDKKEVPLELVFEACKAFLKYEEPGFILPVCISSLFKKDLKAITCIKSVISDATSKIKEKEGH